MKNITILGIVILLSLLRGVKMTAETPSSRVWYKEIFSKKVRVLQGREIPSDFTNVIAQIGKSIWISPPVQVQVDHIRKSLERAGETNVLENGCKNLEDAFLMFIRSTSITEYPNLAFEIGDWYVIQYVSYTSNGKPRYGAGAAIKKGTTIMCQWDDVDMVLGRNMRSDTQVEYRSIMEELKTENGYSQKLVDKAKKILMNGQDVPPEMADDIAVMALSLFRKVEGRTDAVEAMEAYREFSPHIRNVRLQEENRRKWKRYEEIMKEIHELSGEDKLLGIFIRANVLGELDEYTRRSGVGKQEAEWIRKFVREEARKLVEEYPESELKEMLRRMAEGKGVEVDGKRGE